MPESLHTRIWRETAVRQRLSSAVAVGATLLVLDGSIRYAAAVAAMAFCVWLAADAAQVAVGDYADHVVFGLLVFGFVAYTVAAAGPTWVVATGALLGCWFVIDGVQHLRHGITRDEVGISYAHDGGPVTGLLKALLVRLAEPFLL
ncbi:MULTISPECIES: hypothetical protein [Haloarcula]|mgnify:FL=1|jgi:hypothetical protein|uniref:Uncharacterized protein n=1 Tax=Haloarcula marismortui ATCC 33800 TaxID=662476 RepID=M0K2I2_9EURY|nr:MULTISPECIES: hypothetical protein [Haloarcula]EMA14988.1 hypothetical protein C436_04385 [Haloarcula sinaiiensis ATCC 33800]NHX40219.1 hypothetical protein [Haloarcula sp. R1-2]QUJ72149.1 hypothetical protein KDQ40_15910 [Haloarcula sinaiiensis ATCC 33800]